MASPRQRAGAAYPRSHAIGLETRHTARPPRTAGETMVGPGRPSAEDILGIDPAVAVVAATPPAARDPDDLPAFMPSAGMVEVKSTLNAMLLSDPTLVPERLSREQIQNLLGDRRLSSYYKRHGKTFHAWLLNKHEHAAKADALYHRWLFLLEERMPSMADKDLIKLGDLLAELAKKKPERWMKEKLVDGEVAKMDDARMMETMLATMRTLGWNVSIPAGAPGHHLVASESGARGVSEAKAKTAPGGDDCGV